MSGIYIHIPFCKQACSYCDFYFTTHQNEKEEFLSCLKKEISKRVPFVVTEPIRTIYFGGGTPSQLSIDELKEIISSIKKVVNLDHLEEVTLEANPDNLSLNYLKALKSETNINRLSIGIQSFHEKELDLMYRAHSASAGIEAIENARKIGFDNISIDLIYGVPGSDLESWHHNIQEALKLKPEHISAYCLTIEDNTRLKYWIEKGRYEYPDDDLILKQSNMLMDLLSKAGYDHYEISNFSLPNRHSKHNTSYWFGHSFIGLGPSAHSFTPGKRYWNVRSTKEYIKSVNENKIFWQEESLTLTTQYNEYIMTRLRTKWGLNFSEIEEKFGEKYENYLEAQLSFVKKGLLNSENGIITLSKEGKHMADGIAADLFAVFE